MKSILIIGLGRFGSHIARKLNDMGHEVMAVDNNEERINNALDYVTSAQIGDCTNENVVRSLGVNNFDICFVTIGENFQSSLVITSLLKKCGAKYVCTKASQDIQAEFLMKIGADEVVYPEREIAEKLAIRHNAKNIFDYIQLTSEYSLYEIPIIPSWAGQTVAAVNVRKKYRVNIIAIKHDNLLDPLPGGDYVFCEGDHIVVIGTSSDVFRLTSKT